MNSIYYRSIFLIFSVFYMLLYFGATRFTAKIIYVIEPIRVILGKSNRRNGIPLIVVIGHILNTITLIIGVFGHKFIDGRTAFQIYKYSIPVFLAVIFVMQELTEKDDSLK